MLSNVPAMLDCVEARITIQFSDGRQHVEVIELDSETADVAYEMDYLLYLYVNDGISNPHDVDAWLDLAMDGTGCVYPTDEQQEAAETLVAIFDTYLINKSADISYYHASMVDHLGNIMPVEIERHNI